MSEESLEIAATQGTVEFTGTGHSSSGKRQDRGSVEQLGLHENESTD